MADAKKLISERSVLRGRITRLLPELEAAIENEDSTEISALLEGMVSSFNKMEGVSAKVREKLTSDEEIQQDMDQDFNYEVKVNKAKSKATKFFKDKEKPADPAPKPGASSVQLERLNLPKFSGEIERFSEFWSLFNSRIHEDDSLSDADKFSYLISKLTGPAADIIKGIPVGEPGYPKARDLILQRYGKRLPLLNRHINQLMDMPSSESMDVLQLRKLSDQLHIHVRCLESLGVDVKSNAQILGPVLINKLPLQLRIKWQETQASEDGSHSDTIDKKEYVPIDIEEFLRFVAQETEHRELSQRDSDTSSYQRSEECHSNHPYREERRSREKSNTTLNVISKCILCDKGQHPFRNCSVLTSLPRKGRSELVKKHKLCFNCLSPRHALAECNSKYTCRHCN